MATISRQVITGKERHFAPDEFIVSKTNARGIITYANDVFLRIADYSMEEVIGKPHNIIRHPWMPRCIFRMFWERIKSNNEIFAYVVNRSKYGDHYWVMAHVTPSYDREGNIIGYHSNRHVPKSQAVALVAPLYRQLCEIENTAATPQDGMAASMPVLHQWINNNGGNYDALVLSL